jgi:hypothetical protein
MHGAVRILLSLVLVAAGFLAYDMANYYLYSPWTRGARVRAEVVTVAPDVSGYVTDVLVGNDQLVHKGDLLFVIDQERYRLALADAEASKARYDELVQDYHKAVISAFSNVEDDALAATQRNAEQQAAEESDGRASATLLRNRPKALPRWAHGSAHRPQYRKRLVAVDVGSERRARIAEHALARDRRTLDEHLNGGEAKRLVGAGAQAGKLSSGARRSACPPAARSGSRRVGSSVSTTGRQSGSLVRGSWRDIDGRLDRPPVWPQRRNTDLKIALLDHGAGHELFLSGAAALVCRIRRGCRGAGSAIGGDH